MCVCVSVCVSAGVIEARWTGNPRKSSSFYLCVRACVGYKPLHSVGQYIEKLRTEYAAAKK